MTDTLSQLERLSEILAQHSQVAVAFSGGVDSTLLAAMAHRVLPGKAVALTARTPLVAERELIATGKLVGILGFRHQWVDIDLLADANVAGNSKLRCYHCKVRLLGKLAKMAKALGQSPLVHGANLDDDGDYRPGQRAAKELAVAAPLALAGMNKADVRRAAKHLGLPNWDKPAMACLASRIPYGDPLSDALLRRVERAESAVLAAGAATCRVRVHGSVARIEAPLDNLNQLMQPSVRHRLVAQLRQLGFDHVSIDLEGLVSGSMNRCVSDDGAGNDA